MQITPEQVDALVFYLNKTQGLVELDLPNTNLEAIVAEKLKEVKHIKIYYDNNKI